MIKNPIKPIIANGNKFVGASGDKTSPNRLFLASMIDVAFTRQCISALYHMVPVLNVIIAKITPRTKVYRNLEGSRCISAKRDELISIALLFPSFLNPCRRKPLKTNSSAMPGITATINNKEINEETYKKIKLYTS